MLCGMQEIARFLATHPPFDGLPPEALEQTAATVEIAYFPRGASILRQSGEPSRYLHVIVKGVVELRQADERGASELVETLAEGETFGQHPAGGHAGVRGLRGPPGSPGLGMTATA
jgi:CBS domain-containing protein